MTRSKSYSLHELANALTELAKTRKATQQQLAEICQLDQSFISRAKTASLRKKSKKTDLLFEAAIRILNSKPPGKRTLEEMHKFYAIGGTDAELRAVIAHAGLLIGRRISQKSN